MEEANVNVGVNETEAAELSTGAETESSVTETTETGAEGTSGAVNETETEQAATPAQSAEDNARFAAARRKSEAEVNRLNKMFAEKFGNFTNPVTGEPITSAEGYLLALEAQKRQQQEQQLRSKGIDPSIIDEMVNNSPAIREAQAIITQNREAEAQRALEADLKTVSQMDPDIKSFADLEALPDYPKIYEYVSKHGLNLVDAYRLACSEKLSGRQTAAAKQAAINNAKSTSHLETTRGVSTGDGTMVPIPSEVLPLWKEAYPGLTMDQLTAKYNAAIG